MGVAQGNTRPLVAVHHTNITHRHACPRAVSKSLTEQLATAAGRNVVLGNVKVSHKASTHASGQLSHPRHPSLRVSPHSHYAMMGLHTINTRLTDDTKD